MIENEVVKELQKTKKKNTSSNLKKDKNRTRVTKISKKGQKTHKT